MLKKIKSDINCNTKRQRVKTIPVWIQVLNISTGLKTILSDTEHYMYRDQTGFFSYNYLSIICKKNIMFIIGVLTF